MTEADWFTTHNSKRIIAAAWRKVPPRRWRLFMAAWGRRIWEERRTDDILVAVEMAEQYAVGKATKKELEALAREYVGRLVVGISVSSLLWPVEGQMEEAVEQFCRHAGGWDINQLPLSPERWVRFRSDLDLRNQMIRDVAGNPFRPVRFLPAWRTSAALHLARGMYESRDFAAMPILADALQEAGCDNDDVLNHCRAEGVHVRGCWVVDGVLGKS